MINIINHLQEVAKGSIFILSAPSGTGKSSVAKKLLEQLPNLWLSVSVTTRAKRNGEVEGLDYYFLDNSTYLRLQEEGQLLESAKVYDHHYGTMKKVVFNKLNQGIDVLFDIDWQGARNLRQNSEVEVVSIFLLPPSLAELENRLIIRGDNIEVIAKRMQQAESQIAKRDEYDYILVNDDLEETVTKVMAIITSHKT